MSYGSIQVTNIRAKSLALKAVNLSKLPEKSHTGTIDVKCMETNSSHTYSVTIKPCGGVQVRKQGAIAKLFSLFGYRSACSVQLEKALMDHRNRPIASTKNKTSHVRIKPKVNKFTLRAEPEPEQEELKVHAVSNSKTVIAKQSANQVVPEEDNSDEHKLE